MYKITVFLLLFLSCLPAFAEEDKPGFTDEQLQKLKAAEQEYKDDPEKMRILNQFKQGLGISDESPAETPPAPPPPSPKHITTTGGSMAAANAAYSRGDYETALEQYKAVAASGNAEANAFVGMMYEAGLGTEEPDMAAAQAWYRRAAESEPDDKRYSRLINEKTIESYESEAKIYPGQTRISGKDAAKADIYYNEINQEIKELEDREQADTPPGTLSTYESGGEQYSTDSAVSGVTGKPAAIPLPEHKTARYVRTSGPGSVKFIPEKIAQPRYPRPEMHTDHFHPEKFPRQPDVTAIEKS